jgi:hypothetical protein
VEAAEEVVHVVAVAQFFVLWRGYGLDEDRELVGLGQDVRKVVQPQVGDVLELLYMENPKIQIMTKKISLETMKLK